MNRVELIGRMVRDAEVRYTGSDKAVASYTIAVNRPFSNQNGEREADFINCVTWGKQAENLSKYCSKGSLIGVEGRIQVRSYDTENNEKRYVTEVVADRVEFLDSKKEQTNTQTAPRETEKPQKKLEDDIFKDFGSQMTITDDDLPF